MPPRPEFTDSQATDLARHFLGPGWKAISGGGFNKRCSLRLPGMFEKGVPRPFVSSVVDHNPRGTLFFGDTWRETFRAAGVKLPARPRFANVGKRVMIGTDEVAICTSASYAERITKLLNQSETE